jgi:membrane peptidoglycan carboxypeptidase
MLSSIDQSRYRSASRAVLLLTLATSAAVAQESQPAASTAEATKAQSSGPAADAKTDAANAGVDKRVFGVLPNYRTANGSAPFEPITAKRKFMIATKDSFDTPVLYTTAFFAGYSQLTGSANSVYGQGIKGFAYRYGINYVDQVVGNYFPEAIIPSVFHTDPRYFRKGTGSIASRIWYAFDRIFVCKNDRGNTTFNVNEWVGNSVGALATSSYHPHQRTVGDMASEGGSFILSDTIGQQAKEFWPDIKRKFFKKHDASH